MNPHAIPSQGQRLHDSDLLSPQNKWPVLLEILGLLVWSIYLTGCASQTVITETDRIAVSSGEKALVLLRVQCTVDNQPFVPFINPTLTEDPIIFFGLGTFETIGEPRITGHRFLSEESRRAGWTYFVLTPGIYYLAVIGPDSSSMSKAADSQYFQEAPRWRIDVPADVKLIYAGTIQLTGKSDGELLFGGKVITSVNSEKITLGNEHALASALLAEHFPGIDTMKTILMQRWHQGDSIIIRTPKQNSH